MAVYRQNPNAAGRVIDDRAFIVTPGDSKLHMLNRTATDIWSLAADGVTLEKATAHIAECYEIDAPTAAGDIQTCCSDLVRRGILVADR